MAYSHNPSTDEGMLRTLIYDTTEVASPTKETDFFFDDDELTNALDLNSSDLWRAAADLCRSLSARFARRALDLGLGKGDIKIDNTKRADFYRKLAASYDNRSDSDVVEYVDSVVYDVSNAGSDNSEYVGDLT